MRKIVILAFFNMILFSNAAFADSNFRWGGRLVSIGDTTYEVLGKCGTPNYQEIRRVIITGGLKVYYKGKSYSPRTFGDPGTGDEIWFYDCGPKRFIKILTFVNSKLSLIETGGYGFNKHLPCPRFNDWSKRKRLAEGQPWILKNQSQPRIIKIDIHWYAQRSDLMLLRNFRNWKDCL